MSRRKIDRIALLLLLIGFGSALAIYLNANAESVGPQLEDPLATKKYLREMQMIGGQANVVASEMRAWFAGLWHGRTLAGTVAVLTVVATLGFRLVATHPDFAPPLPEADRPPAA
jgi:hypothetical protein